MFTTQTKSQSCSGKSGNRFAVEKPGRVSKFFEAKLGPDEAFEIDCPDILRHAESKGFLKGFVVLETEAELDAVAVYTSTGASQAVGTFFIERVPVRRR
jgi:hypothetical protein